MDSFGVCDINVSAFNANFDGGCDKTNSNGENDIEICSCKL